MKSYFKTFVFTMICAAYLMMTVGSAVAFDAGAFLVRDRLIWVSPNSGSDTVMGSELLVENDVTLEVDFTYMIHPNFGLELILGTTNHELTHAGQQIGKVGVLPPTILAQYHFLPDSTFKPYAGIGLNYTIFYDGRVNGASNMSDISLKNTFGLAGQIGVDIEINEKWFLNVDAKYISMKTSVNELDDLKVTINPLVIGAGVGTTF